MTISKAAIAAVALFAAVPASAAVLDFDTVTNGTIGSFSEDGFDISTTGFQVTPFGNPAPSLATNSGGSVASITQSGGGAFQFLNFDLADGGVGGTAGVTVQGFLGAVLQFSTVLVPTDGFVNIASPFAGAIDELRFTNDAGGGWLNIENVEVEAISDVPLPASALFLGAGLFGFAAFRKREK